MWLHPTLRNRVPVGNQARFIILHTAVAAFHGACRRGGWRHCKHRSDQPISLSRILLALPIGNQRKVNTSVMNATRRTKVSKYLSKHLRHQPERLGLQLAPGGWVAVDQLLAACAEHHFPITRAELDEVVATNDKQRFSFDPSRTLIRANQGHSVDVDLQLEPSMPPDELYHGTGERTAAAIASAGIIKMSRHHVHLSSDVATARVVGARHGRPVVFIVDARAMRRDGYTFYRSPNGVWLVDQVPPCYLRRL